MLKVVYTSWTAKLTLVVGHIAELRSVTCHMASHSFYGEQLSWWSGGSALSEVQGHSWWGVREAKPPETQD